MRRMLCLMAVLGFLAACDGGPAGPTQEPATTTPTTTTTAITGPSAALPRECLHRRVDDQVTPRSELPAAVDQTRRALIALAAACDFAGLDALAAQGEEPFGYDLSSSFATPGALWAALGQHNCRPMTTLVRFLNDEYLVEEDDQGVRYVWPAAEGEYTQEVRPLVAIAEDGEWMYLVFTERLMPDDLLAPTSSD